MCLAIYPSRRHTIKKLNAPEKLRSREEVSAVAAKRYLTGNVVHLEANVQVSAVNRPLRGLGQNASALHGELVEHLKEAQGAERNVGVDFGIVDVVDKARRLEDGLLAEHFHAGLHKGFVAFVPLVGRPKVIQISKSRTSRPCPLLVNLQETFKDVRPASARRRIKINREGWRRKVCFGAVDQENEQQDDERHEVGAGCVMICVD